MDTAVLAQVDNDPEVVPDACVRMRVVRADDSSATDAGDPRVEAVLLWGTFSAVLRALHLLARAAQLAQDLLVRRFLLTCMIVKLRRSRALCWSPSWQ